MSQGAGSSRRSLWRAAKVVASGAVLTLGFLAFRRLDLHGVLAQMRGLSRASALLVLGVAIAQAFALATRLWIVFPAGARPRWGRVARAFGFGQFANACLPGRAGDVMKVVTIARDRPDGSEATGQATAADVTGAMLADKAIDMVTLGALVLVFAPALLLGVLAAATHAAWIAVAAAGLLVAAVLVTRHCLPAVFDRAVRFASSTCRTLRGALTPGRLACALALGVAAWLAEAGSMLVLSSSFGLHLSLAQTIVGLLVLNLGIAIPVSMGNVGTYEAATMVGLAPFGVAPAQALALGAFHHAVQLVAIALFALAFWLRDRLRPRSAGALAVHLVEDARADGSRGHGDGGREEREDDDFDEGAHGCGARQALCA